MHKLILSFKGRIQKVLTPEGNSCSIGRSPDSDIAIDNLAVEPQHAILHFTDHEASISTTRVQNHILINNARPAEHQDIALAHGDEISIGKHTLTYQWENELTDKQIPSDIEPPRQTAHEGWLQIMNGPRMGRTLQLNKPSMQIGAASGKVALITNRNDGYYLSILDKDISVKVNNNDIGDSVVPLHNGNTIRVGDMEMLFFTQEQ